MFQVVIIGSATNADAADSARELNLRLAHHQQTGEFQLEGDVEDVGALRQRLIVEKSTWTDFRSAKYKQNDIWLSL